MAFSSFSRVTQSHGSDILLPGAFSGLPDQLLGTHRWITGEGGDKAPLMCACACVRVSSPVPAHMPTKSQHVPRKARHAAAAMVNSQEFPLVSYVRMTIGQQSPLATRRRAAVDGPQQSAPSARWLVCTRPFLVSGSLYSGRTA